MERYMEISAGFTSCYTDAFIGDDAEGRLYFVSLFGRPSLVKAVGAAILEGRSVNIGNMVLRRPARFRMHVLTQNLGTGIAHKVIFVKDMFSGADVRIVIGEDKQRAFEFLDSVVSTPLKEEWADTLWQKVFEPKDLIGFGQLEGKDLSKPYLLRLDKTVDEVEDLVLEGIMMGELN